MRVSVFGWSVRGINRFDAVRPAPVKPPLHTHALVRFEEEEVDQEMEVSDISTEEWVEVAEGAEMDAAKVLRLEEAYQGRAMFVKVKCKVGEAPSQLSHHPELRFRFPPREGGGSPLIANSVTIRVRKHSQSSQRESSPFNKPLRPKKTPLPVRIAVVASRYVYVAPRASLYRRRPKLLRPSPDTQCRRQRTLTFPP